MTPFTKCDSWMAYIYDALSHAVTVSLFRIVLSSVS